MKARVANLILALKAPREIRRKTNRCQYSLLDTDLDIFEWKERVKRLTGAPICLHNGLRESIARATDFSHVTQCVYRVAEYAR